MAVWKKKKNFLKKKIPANDATNGGGALFLVGEVGNVYLEGLLIEKNLGGGNGGAIVADGVLVIKKKNYIISKKKFPQNNFNK